MDFTDLKLNVSEKEQVLVLIEVFYLHCTDQARGSIITLLLGLSLALGANLFVWSCGSLVPT